MTQFIDTFHQKFYPESGRMAEEEHVRAIWKDLGVGRSGFLTMPELGHVCKHIGMTNFSNEDLVQLFENLDADGDGLVSFNEFSRCLFREFLASATSTPFDSISGVNLDSQIKPSKGKSSLTQPSNDVAILFSQIDSGGFASGITIIDYWKNLGLSNGVDVLSHLQFDSNGRVSLAELSYVLDYELSVENKMIKDDVVLQAAALSFKSELHHCKAQLDELLQERRKLQSDLSLERSRLTVLAQEGDYSIRATEEHRWREQTNLEHRYQQEIQSLQKELDVERHNFQIQLLMQQRSTETSIGTLKEEDALLKARISKLTQEKSRLEAELLDAEKLNASQQLELKVVADLHTQLTEELNNLRKCQNTNSDTPNVKGQLQEHVEAKKHENRVLESMGGLKKEFTDCRNQLNLVQSELQSKTKESDNLSIKLKESRSENDSLRQRLKEMNTRAVQMDQQKQQWQEANDRMSQALEQSTRQMKEKLVDVETLKLALKDLKMENDKLKVKNEQVQKNKMLADKSLSEREMDVKGLQNDVRKLEAEKEDLSGLIHGLEDSLLKQKKDLNIFKNNSEQLSHSVKELEKAFAQKQRELDENKKVVALLHNEKSKLSDLKKEEEEKCNHKIKELYRENVQLKGERDWMKKQVRSFELEVDELKQKINDLLGELVLQKDTIDTLSSNLANSDKVEERILEIGNLQKEVEALKDSCHKFQSEKEKLSMVKNDLEQEKGDLSKELCDAKNFNKILHCEKSNLQNELNDVKKLLECEVEKAKLSKEKMTLELDKATRNLNSKSNEYSIKQKEYDNLKEIFRESQIEHGRLQHQLEKNANEIEKKTGDVNQLQMDIKTLNVEKNELERKFGELEKMNNEKTNNLNELKIRYDLVCVENSQLDTTLGNYKDKVCDFETQLGQSKRDNIALQDVNGELKRNLEDVKLKMAELDNKLLNLQKEKANLLSLEKNFNVLKMENELKINDLKDKDIKFEILIEENKGICEDLKYKSKQIEHLQAANDRLQALLDQKIYNVDQRVDREVNEFNEVDKLIFEKDTLVKKNLLVERDLLASEQRCNVLERNLDREKSMHLEVTSKLKDVSHQRELNEREILEMKRLISHLDDAFKNKEASQTLHWDKISEDQQAEIKRLKDCYKKAQADLENLKLQMKTQGTSREQLDTLEKNLTESRLKVLEIEQRLELTKDSENDKNELALKFERTRLLLAEQTDKLKKQIEKSRKQKLFIKDLLDEKTRLAKHCESL